MNRRKPKRRISSAVIGDGEGGARSGSSGRGGGGSSRGNPKFDNTQYVDDPVYVSATAAAAATASVGVPDKKDNTFDTADESFIEALRAQLSDNNEQRHTMHFSAADDQLVMLDNYSDNSFINENQQQQQQQKRQHLQPTEQKRDASGNSSNSSDVKNIGVDNANVAAPTDISKLPNEHIYRSDNSGGRYNNNNHQNDGDDDVIDDNNNDDDDDDGGGGDGGDGDGVSDNGDIAGSSVSNNDEALRLRHSVGIVRSAMNVAAAAERKLLAHQKLITEAEMVREPTIDYRDYTLSSTAFRFICHLHTRGECHIEYVNGIQYHVVPMKNKKSYSTYALFTYNKPPNCKRHSSSTLDEFWEPLTTTTSSPPMMCAYDKHQLCGTLNYLMRIYNSIFTWLYVKNERFRVANKPLDMVHSHIVTDGFGNFCLCNKHLLHPNIETNEATAATVTDTVAGTGGAAVRRRNAASVAANRLQLESLYNVHKRHAQLDKRAKYYLSFSFLRAIVRELQQMSYVSVPKETIEWVRLHASKNCGVIMATTATAAAAVAGAGNRIVNIGSGGGGDGSGGGGGSSGGASSSIEKQLRRKHSVQSSSMASDAIIAHSIASGNSEYGDLAQQHQQYRRQPDKSRVYSTLAYPSDNRIVSATFGGGGGGGGGSGDAKRLRVDNYEQDFDSVVF